MTDEKNSQIGYLTFALLAFIAPDRAGYIMMPAVQICIETRDFYPGIRRCVATL